ncbi:hypothetical protein POVCU2_0036380 [Plasmodium ovale curtisi]|uniref:Uncharacterized protein n=1 Tax=Plasmodium ovale curtisi TaxID=864141 RepID=A0A1A8WUN5_PLAOA|nr:hypothetical protein POVCU2_0036380 [Plasmodium ovale curtisi]SBS96671.1 hypothetical protein POVCU1_033360 [Plasmodium ovale curtisi]
MSCDVSLLRENIRDGSCAYEEATVDESCHMSERTCSGDYGGSERKVELYPVLSELYSKCDIYGLNENVRQNIKY